MSSITAETVVNAPLALIVPLVDAEDGVGQGVIAQELARSALHHTCYMTCNKDVTLQVLTFGHVWFHTIVK